jgi:hypothetical protein
VTASNGQTDSHFTYSTVTSPEDGEHPVSGNRTFGIQTDPVNGGYTFYISGVDRATNGLFNLGADVFGWSSASSLWQNVMANVQSYVTDNGGTSGNYPNGFLDTVQDYDNMKGFLDGTDSLEQEMAALGCPS